MRFKGEVAVVTGGTRGIGAAVARKLFAEGCRVVVIGRNDAVAAECAQSIDPSGEKSLGVGCEISNKESVAQAMEKILAKFGQVDILVNNAGITMDSMIQKMTLEQWQKVIDVNLTGTFLMTSAVVGQMRERGWGRIISMSSLAADGNIGQANYSATKAGIIGMTKTLALELAPENITVNCIAPGLINTDIVDSIPEKLMETFLKSIPMHRVGEPEEVASLAAFLASDEAAYITGECIKITGGLR